jgi:hypothetical protein
MRQEWDNRVNDIWLSLEKYGVLCIRTSFMGPNDPYEQAKRCIHDRSFHMWIKCQPFTWTPSRARAIYDVNVLVWVFSQSIYDVNVLVWVFSQSCSVHSETDTRADLKFEGTCNDPHFRNYFVVRETAQFAIIRYNRTGIFFNFIPKMYAKIIHYRCD